MLTSEQFNLLFPKNIEPEAWTSVLNVYLPKFGISENPLRLAAFLAQCGHESNGFTDLVENLNYSAEGLMKTWPRRFTAVLAQQCARKPELIANFAYANRMGNGPYASGDGWRYRGRGLIQLTGADIYREFAEAIGRSLDQTIAYLETKAGAVHSACWFWTDVKKLNLLADQGNTLEVTKRINGGTNGLADRNVRYAKAMAVLAQTA